MASGMGMRPPQQGCILRSKVTGLGDETARSMVEEVVGFDVSGFRLEELGLKVDDLGCPFRAKGIV